jgi:flagellar basal body-associated protein FliL
MYVDGYMLFAIYFIAVLALAVSAYALWSLEEIRKYYAKKNTKPNAWEQYNNKPPITVNRTKGHWD